ncbi:hypothetical protein PR048_004916 [Dryococelus australis]|uniref:Uncharacterized protein n=1 Tax=Dryococelus australis TaxID=614101 RepID=A0ABQ9I6R9_9NEOP|nr:hypothetical protein PR048_004916 [Dryococelus australis]
MYGAKLDSVHNVLHFEQKAWMEQYIEFNIEKCVQAANEFEKYFLIYGKSLQDVHQKRDIRVVFRYDTIYMAAELIGHPTFQERQIIDENLFLIEISEFCYYMCTILPPPALYLLYCDSDSLTYSVACGNVFKVITPDLKAWFDTYNYVLDNPREQRPYRSYERCAGRIVTHFMGLHPKLYAYTVANEQCINKAKGVKSNILQKIRYKDYRDCLKNYTRVLGNQYNFHSRGHKVYAECVTKVVFLGLDNKRYIQADGVSTLSWELYKIPKNEGVVKSPSTQLKLEHIGDTATHLLLDRPSRRSRLRAHFCLPSPSGHGQPCDLAAGDRVTAAVAQKLRWPQPWRFSQHGALSLCNPTWSSAAGANRRKRRVWVEPLNIKVLRADEGEVRRVWNSTGMKGREKLEIPEKARISRHDSHTCGYPEDVGTAASSRSAGQDETLSIPRHQHYNYTPTYTINFLLIHVGRTTFCMLYKTQHRSTVGQLAWKYWLINAVHDKAGFEPRYRHLELFKCFVVLADLRTAKGNGKPLVMHPVWLPWEQRRSRHRNVAGWGFAQLQSCIAHDVTPGTGTHKYVLQANSDTTSVGHVAIWTEEATGKLALFGTSEHWPLLGPGWVLAPPRLESVIPEIMCNCLGGGRCLQEVAIRGVADVKILMCLNMTKLLYIKGATPCLQSGEGPASRDKIRRVSVAKVAKSPSDKLFVSKFVWVRVPGLKTIMQQQSKSVQQGLTTLTAGLQALASQMWTIYELEGVSTFQPDSHVVTIYCTVYVKGSLVTRPFIVLHKTSLNTLQTVVVEHRADDWNKEACFQICLIRSSDVDGLPLLVPLQAHPVSSDFLTQSKMDCLPSRTLLRNDLHRRVLEVRSRKEYDGRKREHSEKPLRAEAAPVTFTRARICG